MNRPICRCPEVVYNPAFCIPVAGPHPRSVASGGLAGEGAEGNVSAEGRSTNVEPFPRSNGLALRRFSLAWVTACWLVAQAAAADAPRVTVTPVVQRLLNPCGVAVQPGTGDVFVSESGRARVLRVVGNRGEPVISGFPLEKFTQGDSSPFEPFEIGPLGLAFTDQNTLLVGGGGLPEGADLLQVFAVPPRGGSIPADQSKQTLGPIARGRASSSGEGDFFGVVATKKAIFATCQGDDQQGWIARSLQSGGTWGSLLPFTPTKKQTGVDAPMGIAINPDGQLVVAQMGELNGSRDSWLGFYDPVNGDLLASFSLPLHDVVALAYSPHEGKLYALDFAWGQPENQGGLFRLDAVLRDRKPAVAATKVVQLQRPTAMAFEPKPNGNLWVTVFGRRDAADTPPDNSADPASDPPADTPRGSLLRISGSL